ncbi:alkaline phosphatase family protein [Chitinophaga arvensicola]|nr:alkaline phosphatase family protein [Chitinophaga arvensicola]
MKKLFPLFPVLLLLLLAACFKEKMAVVGLPNDIDPNDTTQAPVKNGVKRKVLLIGISGVRGDAMREATAPNILGLIPHAVYSFDAVTQAPTNSGATWSSLLTGVWSDKHGVTDNTFAGNRFIRFPMGFRYLKTLLPQLRTLSLQAWPAVNNQLVTQADVTVSLPDNDAAVRDSAVNRLKTDPADIVVVGFSQVQTTAHNRGYGPAVPEYMSAITTVDGYVGDLLTALNSRPEKEKEDWLIIVTSDHGGTGNTEGSSSFPERNIFTIISNKKFTKKEVVPPLNSLRAIRYSEIGDYAYSKDPLYNFDSIKQFTVALSVRSAGFDYDPSFIGNKNWASGNNAGWLLCPKGSDKWKFQAGDGAGGARVDLTSTGPAITDNMWHTIAITVDRRTAPGTVVLFQDGVQAGTSSLNNLSPFAPSNDIKLAVGEDITGTYRETDGGADFQLANIRIWDTVWAKADMQKYNHCDTVQVTNPYYSRMIGWWKGIENTGNKLTDAGPLKRDLTLHNPAQWLTQEIDFCNGAIPAPVPQTVDVLPTLLSWLHIAVDPGWNLDGVSWLP